MNEREFLLELNKRATEQQKVMQDMPFPKVFTMISIWLGNHPWRILIPIAIFLSVCLHLLLGIHYDNLILKIFGGFNIFLKR